MKGIPVYTAPGRAKIEIGPELQLNGQWHTPDQLGKEMELTWGDNILDLSSLQSVENVRFTFSASFDLKSYADAYSVDKIIEDTEFVIRTWNIASRVRRVTRGETKLVKTRNSSRRTLQCTKKEMIFELAEFNGEVEIQPLLITKNRLHDRRMSRGTDSVWAEKGSIIGWTDPLTIILDRARTGVDSLFEFKWVSFSNGGVPGLSDEEFFSIRWDSRPVLYLNQDVEGLETVLTSTAGTGRVARARDEINSLIAHQAISVALGTSIYSAREMHLLAPDLDPSGVFESLSALERLVIRSWIFAADTDGNGPNTSYVESFERLLTMDDKDVQRALVEVLPRNLQVQLGSKKATGDFLKQFMERTSDHEQG